MTPLIKFNQVYLKREDQNITGSAKDRAMSLQVKYLVDHKYNQAVISSTGNAAISAKYYCQQYNIPLIIYVSPHTHPQKLSLLSGSTIIQSLQPISEAYKFAKTNHSYFLRQSTDPMALIGYQQISAELLSDLPDITSIFIPVGSGTTLLGISQKLPLSVKIFAIQPASYCPISKYFDTTNQTETHSLTDSLSVKYLPLKDRIIKTITASQGSGIIVSNQEVIKYQKLLQLNNIFTSPEGALALAGYYQSLNHFSPGNFPVVLLTGALR